MQSLAKKLIKQEIPFLPMKSSQLGAEDSVEKATDGYFFTDLHDFPLDWTTGRAGTHGACH